MLGCPPPGHVDAGWPQGILIPLISLLPDLLGALKIHSPKKKGSIAGAHPGSPHLALGNFLFLSRPSPGLTLLPEPPGPCRQSECSSAGAGPCSQGPLWKGADELVQIKMQ